jgi:hypothetical protein
LTRWLRQLIQGAAHVLDLGGTMAPTLDDVQTDDAAALRSDRDAVARDYWIAIGSMLTWAKRRVGDMKKLNKAQLAEWERLKEAITARRRLSKQRWTLITP